MKSTTYIVSYNIILVIRTKDHPGSEKGSPMPPLYALLFN